MTVAYIGKTKKDLVLEALGALDSDASLDDVRRYLRKNGVPRSIADVHKSIFYPLKREFVNKVKADSGKSTSQIIREFIHEHLGINGVLPDAGVVKDKVKAAKRECNSSLIYQQIGEARKTLKPQPKGNMGNALVMQEVKKDPVVKPKVVRRTFKVAVPKNAPNNTGFTVSDLNAALTLTTFLHHEKWTLETLERAVKVLAAVQL